MHRVPADQHFAAPESSDWVACAQKNRHDLTKLAALRSTLRHEICGALNLQQQSHASLLLVTGHQAAIPHPGVVEKTRLISELVSSYPAEIIGLNLVVDTDEHHGLRFSLPRIEPGAIRLEEHRLLKQHGLALSAKVPDRSTLDKKITDVAAALVGTPFQSCALSALSHLKEEAESPLTPGFSRWLTRSYAPARNLHQLALTRVCALPSIQKLFGEWCLDGIRLHDCYQRARDTIRERSHARSAAQPVPALRSSGDSYELPFWLIEHELGVRSPLFIRKEAKGVTLISQGLARGSVDNNGTIDCSSALLAPRALITSMMLRVFVSDLFVRGTGGARYDRVTDELIERFLAITPPETATVSRTRILFPNELAQLQENLISAHDLRRAHFHPQLLETLALDLPHHTRAAIDHLEHERQRILPELRTKQQERAPRRELTQAFKRIDRERAQIISEVVLRSRRLADPVSLATLAVYGYREFPFFLFETV